MVAVPFYFVAGPAPGERVTLEPVALKTGARDEVVAGAELRIERGAGKFYLEALTIDGEPVSISQPATSTPIQLGLDVRPDAQIVLTVRSTADTHAVFIAAVDSAREIAVTTEATARTAVPPASHTRIDSVRLARAAHLAKLEREAEAQALKELQQAAREEAERREAERAAAEAESATDEAASQAAEETVAAEQAAAAEEDPAQP